MPSSPDLPHGAKDVIVPLWRVEPSQADLPRQLMMWHKGHQVRQCQHSQPEDG